MRGGDSVSRNGLEEIYTSATSCFLERVGSYPPPCSVICDVEPPLSTVEKGRTVPKVCAAQARGVLMSGLSCYLHQLVLAGMLAVPYARSLSAD